MNPGAMVNQEIGPEAEADSRMGSDGARHSLLVRVTHWVAAGCFLALLVSGVELVISHPRFYWGEEGNVNTPTLFKIPIPSSRGSVPTGYKFVMSDQNGWSRYLHFQTAWLVVPTGLVYVLYGLGSGHFRRNLAPSRADLEPAAFAKVVASHLRFDFRGQGRSYNSLQRLAYMFVVFGAFPFMVWTGLAMSPAVTGTFPFLVTVLGGHQSARTLHFLDTLFLVGFVVVHVAMVCRAGFRERMRGMITGESKENS